MSVFEVLVEVSLREGIADPEGATAERALHALGYGEVDSVRMGKAIRFRVTADDEERARARVEEMCQRFLANPVIEQHSVTLHAAVDA